ncbi:cupin domain-containing protein [Stygiobacter electus]|uniref:Cupin domain-containing protein n=1 Tax=Stygiobacter electus TaxID=3032292 RepID=A0AAE3TBU5_9BACT|nr:cupin domain-containing protein [Stygiobacter electus]MDF1611698.1 cupin domain-containing protein [Stygiobacter electus]
MKYFLTLLIFYSFNIFPQTQNFTPQIIFPDEIKWKSTGQKDYSVETFSLLGNPNENGIYVQMVKIPPNTKLLPHFHPDNRTVYVIEGEFFYCYENSFDETKEKKISKGSFFTEPANQPHFAFTKENYVILYVNGIGPTKTTFITNK